MRLLSASNFLVAPHVGGFAAGALIALMTGAHARARSARDPACRYAVSIAAAAARPSSAMASSRMRNFCTLPVTVMGKESTSFQ